MYKYSEWGDAVGQWFALSPHRKKVVGSIPGGLGPPCVAFACPLCVFVCSLRLPPTVQRHACEVNRELKIVCRCVCEWLFVLYK